MWGIHLQRRWPRRLQCRQIIIKQSYVDDQLEELRNENKQLKIENETLIKENTELKLQIEKFQKNNKEINKQRIMEKIFNKTIYEISDMLNYESGFFGMTGKKDMKEIFDEWKNNSNDKSFLAVEIYFKEIIERISGFFGLMEGVDLIVFSGGIGFKNKYLVKEVIKRLEKTFGKRDFLKIEVDEEKIIFEKISKIK